MTTDLPMAALNIQQTCDNISCLPTELLIIIFSYCASEEPQGPTTIRGVCRRWANIADAVPVLWRRILLDNTKLPISKLQHQAVFFLQRSEPFPLDVEVRTHDPERVLPILAPLLPSIGRWESFTSVGFRNEHVDMKEWPLSSNVVSPIPLDRLVLAVHELEPEDDEGGGTTDDTNPFFKYQSTFTLDGSMQLRIASLPSSAQLVPLHFTHLTISEGVLEPTHTNAAAILDLLLAFPVLRVFIFEGWQHDDEPFSYPTPLPLVSLPYLEVLHIRTTCFIRRLLSRLYTPRLRTLILAYLNVDFRVQSAVYEGDEGDSEDEAHDFSQSPWSDHATGMGLRSLISRSRPPLQVLEMDYSDMRTKDFRWVFDRLTDLEEFRIVASDMSNKVIDLLRPVRSTRDGSVATLRLPQLRKLHLDHCQRLAGDALVVALAERTAFTDSSHIHNKFADVTVTACDQVETRHEDALQIILGPRFNC